MMQRGQSCTGAKHLRPRGYSSVSVYCVHKATCIAGSWKQAVCVLVEESLGPQKTALSGSVRTYTAV